ncbi:hypothetical protein SODALDRAFT_270652 [Sodiomyces alkalinus F11]|uniref:AGC-kinase C-terminal domain-containing protein n=1 Tax=Sodiomyces alkalinus (strain CBS 110278 / VKM F-3762 / F11) TaxID=1314773 RepID=A0A3N2Q2L2_SODAK|nr:hypothetical protein SODALDRAFT_270652 [Sodiomyces alkalinus F11]ROT41004.1 hypothetical protein SODALDRAFT_270652 [Sodiomyces alkalinus F11]
MPCAIANGCRLRPTKPQSPPPGAFELRKPSLSYSVSSVSSSSTNLPSPSMSRHHRHSRHLEFDPLALHPTYHAASHPTFVPPPRLGNRPFILNPNHETAVYSDSDAEDDILEEYFRADEASKSADSMSAPAVGSPTPMQHTGHERQAHNDEGGDYFMYKLRLLEHQERQQREAMSYAVGSRSSSPSAASELPRSRWSDSTIASTDLDLPQDGQEEEKQDDDASTYDEEDYLHIAVPERQPRHAKSWQNFSYKRTPAVAPRRPPLTMDGVEAFIKRGGWKRKGIVFEKDDVPTWE